MFIVACLSEVGGNPHISGEQTLHADGGTVIDGTPRGTGNEVLVGPVVTVVMDKQTQNPCFRGNRGQSEHRMTDVAMLGWFLNGGCV